MSSSGIPDPLLVAQREAKLINGDREQYLQTPLDRVIADSPSVNRDAMVAGLEEFHAQRMQMIPSAARFPEAGPWVDYVVTVDKELQRLTNMTPREMASYRSLHQYLTFRGFRQAAAASQASVERCRAVYVPDSPQGQLQLKNLDDPPKHWVARPAPTSWPLPDGNLGSDGVGSGLHIDEEPDELFPLPITTMLRHYANDVPSAVEFLTRYSPFWGRANLMLYDKQKRSVAIEKCSYKYIQVHYPGADGVSYISGMTCRDPESEIGRHQKKMRDEYLRMFNRPADGPDSLFWDACRQFNAKLRDGLKNLGADPLPKLIDLFTRPWPQGLNKGGLKLHPEQGLIGYTLATNLYMIDKRIYMRWQRATGTLEYPDQPEVFQF